jgi:hypothetical protein
MTIPDDRLRQFEMLAAARSRLLAWSQAEGVPLHKVEYIVPFVETDFDAHVLLFVETDDQIPRFRQSEAEAVFTDALRSVGYPEQHVALLTFEVDSHECVERDYEGSYFYRLR